MCELFHESTKDLHGEAVKVKSCLLPFNAGKLLGPLTSSCQAGKAPDQIKSGYHIIKEEKVLCPDYIRGVLAVWF